jgi:transcriptional regulator of aromatic amino acid metabolism
VKAPDHLTVVEAAKRLAMLDLALLAAEIERGMCKKAIEERASFSSVPRGSPPFLRANQK